MPRQKVIDRLRSVLGDDRVSTSRPDRVAYSADMWPRMQIDKAAGRLPQHQPDCVVWPSSVEEVSTVLRVAEELRAPVVPYGAGSGVCGGAVPESGGVVVDVRRLDRIHAIDEVSMTLDVGAGVIGHHLQRALEERGLTLGHFPSSILCSTVGGWVAARSAGQMSSRYGKIEDMVLGLEVVLAGGRVLRCGSFGRSAQGPGAAWDEFAPDWSSLFVGSEGTLGVITRVLLRIEVLAEHTELRGIAFGDLEGGVEAMRQIMQEELRPGVLRLYDPVDTLLHSAKKSRNGDQTTEASRWSARSVLGRLRRRLPGGETGSQSWIPSLGSLRGPALRSAVRRAAVFNRVGRVLAPGCRLVIGLQGRPDQTTRDLDQVLSIARSCGGKDQGPGPGLEWYEHRYDVSFKQMQVYEAGAFVDTFEVSTSWSRLLGLYDHVRSALQSRAVVLAHFSHAYADGCSIYFTIIAAAESVPGNRDLYDELWRAALDAAIEAGAAVSHHHGIGILKRDALARAWGDGALLFRELKAELDPNGIMNPGTLLPPNLHRAGGGRNA